MSRVPVELREQVVGYWRGHSEAWKLSGLTQKEYAQSAHTRIHGIQQDQLTKPRLQSVFVVKTAFVGDPYINNWENVLAHVDGASWSPKSRSFALA